MLSVFPESLLNSMSARILILGIGTLGGYYMGGLARRLKLPSTVGYMLAGLMLGPTLFHLLTESSLHDLTFIINIALGFVTFSIGAELRVRDLRKLGLGIVGIIFGSSLFAFFLVLIGVFVYTRDWPLALVFAAVAQTTAPEGTMAVIQECRAKGKLTQALYAVVGFADGLAIIVFTFIFTFARVLLMSAAGVYNGGFLAVLTGPIFELGGGILIGSFLGFLFGFIVRRVNRSPEILILLFSLILLATGLAMVLGLSLILTNMCVGFVLVNTRSDVLVRRATEPLRSIMPLLFVMFFCLAGAHLHLQQLMGLGLLGLTYILCRSAGKVFGAMIGARFGDVAPVVRKWAGVGILSQSGVAIGLALVVQEGFRELTAELQASGPQLAESLIKRPAEIGDTLIMTIMAACVFFEIVGPICARFALEKAGETTDSQASASAGE